MIEGADKEVVGQVAAEIRNLRKPEPTRARASSTRAKSSGARPVRREVSNAGEACTEDACGAPRARHVRVRAKVAGTAERPRLVVFRSLKHMTAQLVDDVQHKTLMTVTDSGLTGKKTEKSVEVGKRVAEKAKAAGITKVVFDRAGYQYHGRVKAVADGAREGGLEF